MSHAHKQLGQVIDEMRSIAHQLTPHTYPAVPRQEARVVDSLKQRTACVDGYELTLHFGVQDFDTFRIERLEIVAMHVPFVPMYLVCKLAAKFLGGHDLRYSEAFKMGRQVYIWTVAVDSKGRPVPMTDSGLEKCSYEHFAYTFITPG